MKRLIFLLLGIGVSFGCLAVLTRNTDFEELKQAFVNADYSTIPAMLALLLAFYWLKAIRWKWLLAPVQTFTTRELFAPVMAGFAVNNMVPAHLGEFVRVFFVRQRYGVPVGTALSTVVLERIFDVLAILALFGIGVVYSGGMPAAYQNTVQVILALAVCGVVAVVAYLIWTEKFIQFTEWCFSFLPFIPKFLTVGVIDLLRRGAEGLMSLKNAKSIVLISLNSIVQWLINGLIAWIALRSFQIEVTPAAGLIVTGVTAAGVTIPSTPGYFGVIQLCFSIALQIQETPPDPTLVLGASVYYQLTMYIPVTILGMYYLNQAGFSLRKLQDAAANKGEMAQSQSN
ncbi:MAG: flippase-like domain-containing protein [Planctomycetaceae bacterium]|nr:flippase-like domain-containing protein [Planctomycetaceae bacterium]